MSESSKGRRSPWHDPENAGGSAPCRPTTGSARYRKAARRPPIVLSVDEYETIRLMDLEGYTQQQCARQMGIARTTVQGIYDLARNKIARALVGGTQLLIQGGEYRLCQGKQDFPCCCHCTRQPRRDSARPKSDEKETQQHE